MWNKLFGLGGLIAGFVVFGMPQSLIEAGLMGAAYGVIGAAIGSILTKALSKKR
jgi:hypothetical protein